MDVNIFKNSYIIFVLSLIILFLLFYFFNINPTVESKNGKVIRKTNWRQPLAISLLIWVLWHFCFFPPQNDFFAQQNYNISEKSIVAHPKLYGGVQKINMLNWN